MSTRRFNRGYALIFLLILLLALFSIYQVHEAVAGQYQNKTAAWVDYTLDDWLAVFHLDQLLGEPKVEAVPAYRALATPTPVP